MAPRAVLPLAIAAGVGAQLQIPWSTDFDNTIFGPDGPWQAVLVKLDGTETNQIPLWPGGSSVSEIPTVEDGGVYSVSDSAVKTGRSRSASDSWSSTLFTEASWSGDEYWDTMELEPRLGSSHEIKIKANFVAATNWTSGAPLNETNYKPSVGILGLGPRSERSDNTTVPSILEQLKASGEIDRNGFSVHMGSAALDLAGSFVLGGYEQNRAIGQVGTYRLTDNFPMMCLRDVIMDVEIDNSTIYPENTEIRQQYAQYAGGAPGSVVVTPNPASPYVYLPPGFCEGIATNLRMVLHEATGLYLWGSDPQAETFVKSSAYLGFVLSDQSATNFTIKVPFNLLNLTLEPPLVEKSVNYFPCKSTDSVYGFWQLGRAFLQAAFLAVDYDREVFYLAQAPGPGMEQSVMKKSDNSTITWNAAESFTSTWRNFWEPVSVIRSSETETENTGPSDGGKAGVVVAAVIGAFAGLWFWRRRRKSKKDPNAPSAAVDKALIWFSKKRGGSKRTKVSGQTSLMEANGDQMDHRIEQKMSTADNATELDGRTPISELDSPTLPAEVGAPLP
ncbi:uncharacterized protein ColSpa_11512 [Colletotrichum spaethianum]|uniref:Peptidase A1 domain-containing protein n=1 Tax=Colletotrichum spaethianum TaxID=700344 RepID=A0AA37UL92_9PEZI|nr:uncharacterized protein ColSpa_11512 [Colletotrichum spaethianum]GKT51331.1 hypothetical protein ColSpa_11512 [Colletotrichum spaethianum]